MARRANTLQTLLNDINAAYPDRDKASDGWIADANHPSTSDHSPRDGIGYAIDVDEDNVVGDQVVGQALLWWILATLPDWIKYVIYEDHIYSSYPVSDGKGGTIPPWTARPYSGTNAHRHHMHISAKDDRFYSGPHFKKQEHIMASDPTWLEENDWPEWSWDLAKKYATKNTRPNIKVSDLSVVQWLALIVRVFTRR